MGLDLADFEAQARNAVRMFWTNRDAARLKQLESGESDRGERAGVTNGKNMDGFALLVRDIVRRNGLVEAEIHTQRSMLTLPGFYRPTKQWDMLVLNKTRLIAALEFKSQAGPSFGNNFNNRVEEAIGTAVDLLTAYREGALGPDAPRPFLGWMMLLEDCEASRAPVRDVSPHFATFPEFKGASYAERYNILCRKLVQEQLYTAACFIRSERKAAKTGEYSELSELTGLRNLVTSLAGHIAAEAARQ
jgi:hypothetical protein